jgi:integrase/recombinase XerC
VAKPAEPWKWKARKGWYAWVKGKRKRLASATDGKQVAIDELARLLAVASAGPQAAPLVGQLVVEYLTDLISRRQNDEIDLQTKSDAERRMAGFADMHGDKPVGEIKPFHVDDWLKTKAEWGPTSRHDGVGAVKSMFRWALRKGRIDRNPLDGLDKPKRKAKRDRIPTTPSIDKTFDLILYPELRDILVFLRETGCRPKEARDLEAKHLDRESGRAVLTEHKTARKTAKSRVLYLTPVASEVAYRLADLRPEGPIFLNSAGKPWTRNAVGHAIRRLRKRAGVGKEMVAYGLRHAFATDGLARKVSPALVAELLGHSDLRMMATYSHLSDHHDALREAASKVRGDDTPSSAA